MTNKIKVAMSIPSIGHKTTVELTKKQSLQLLSLLNEMMLEGMEEDEEEHHLTQSVSPKRFVQVIHSEEDTIQSEPVEEVLDYEDYMEQYSSDVSSTDTTELSDNPFEFDRFFRKYLLVTFKCSHCGTLSTQKTQLAEDNHMTCHYCKKDTEIKEVERADVECNVCKQSFFYYNANGLMHTECRNCRTQINLLRNSVGELLSANLVLR